MANANNNVNGNNNGKGISRREVIESANNGEGDLVAFVGELRGNRELRLKDLGYNTVSVKTDIDGEENYIEVLTLTENAPSDGVTAHDISQNPELASAPSVVSGIGRRQVRKTKNGVKKTLVVVSDLMVVYQASDGDLPAHSLAVVESAPETADEPAQESPQAAPDAQDAASGPGKVYRGGKVYIQKGGADFRMKSLGETITGKKAEGAEFPYVRLGNFCHVGLTNLTNLSDIEADEIIVLPVGAEFVDGFFGRGDFTVVSEPVDEDGVVGVGLQSPLYPGRTFTLKTPGGAGQFARSYALGSQVGDNIHVVDSKLDPATGYLMDAKAANTTKRDAKRAAKVAQAA